jgi:cobalt-zinc-cadmium efflux system outer membrane protein
MKTEFFWQSFMLLATLLTAFATLLGAQGPKQNVRPTLPASTLLVSADHDRQLERAPSQGAPTVETFTLEQLLQMARASNPTLGQAEAGIREAAGRALQAGLWPNPTVGYAGDEIRGGSFGGGEHGVFVQQNVILGGKLGLDRRIFAEEGKQTEAEAEEQRRRVENGVRIAFYQLLAAQQMVEIRMKLSALAKDAVETTTQLFNIGQADQPDLLQAQVEADEADLAVVNAQQDQQRAWRVLSAVVGRPTMPMARLEGNIEDLPSIDSEQILQTILRDSPAVKIAQVGVTRADAALTRAKREIVPDLSLRAGLSNDFESLEVTPPRTVGLVGFAEVGVNLRLFNRNQGNVQAAKGELDRAKLEVQRVSLVLRQMAAPLLQDFFSARAVAETYKTRTMPNAQRAYELYLRRYREGAAAYPQVLIAQRTLFDLQTHYVVALESVWMNAIALQGLMLTDGLDLPTAPGEFDRPVREINLPVVETPGAQP